MESKWNPIFEKSLQPTVKTSIKVYFSGLWSPITVDFQLRVCPFIGFPYLPSTRAHKGVVTLSKFVECDDLFKPSMLTSGIENISAAKVNR